MNIIAKTIFLTMVALGIVAAVFEFGGAPEIDAAHAAPGVEQQSSDGMIAGPIPILPEPCVFCPIDPFPTLGLTPTNTPTPSLKICVLCPIDPFPTFGLAPTNTPTPATMPSAGSTAGL